MLGHHLEPSGLFKGDYLVLSLDNLLVEDRPKSTIHRVKEIVRAPGPPAARREDRQARESYRGHRRGRHP